LDKAHQHGVVHRDLKPANVMLTPNGPKLLDFGLAKLGTGVNLRGGGNSPSPLTSPGVIAGTIQYMAPEQFEGKEADARSDIFAFGTVLYEMLTGKKAFEGKTRILLISAITTAEPEPLSTLQPTTPPALERALTRCLAKDPEDRWQSIHTVLAS